MSTPIHVLILEDRAADAELMLHELQQAGYDADWQRVESEPDFLAELETNPDLILADWSLPQFSGLRALQLANERGQNIPFVIVSGIIGEEAAVEAMRLGAADYLMKDRMGRLGQAVHHALEDKQRREERKQAEVELRESEGKYRTLFEGSSQGILATDIETNRFIDANPSICRMFGYSKEELLRLGIMEIHPQEAHDEIKSGMERQKQKGSSLSPEIPCLRKDGTIFYADISGATTVIHGRRCIVGFFVDVTERKRAEQALKDSEQRFRDIADNAQEFIWEVDPQGRLTYISHVAEKILGYTVEEFQQKKFYDFFYPEDREAITATVFAAFAAKQPFREFINRSVHKNGQTVWLSVSALPMLDDKGNLLGYRGANTDITERKRAEDALRDSEAKYRTLVENIPQKIFMKDRDSKFLSVNENFARDLGIRPADIVGKTDYDFYPKDLSDMYRSDDLRIMETQHLEEIEEKHLQEGIETWVHTIKTPVKDAHGEVVALLGVFWDITARKLMEIQLHKQLEELRLWHQVTLGREVLVLDLKGEVNELLVKAGQPPRYPCAVTESQ